MHKNVSILSIALALSMYAQAQILNIEKFRIDKDTNKYWLAAFNLGMSLKNQNVVVHTFSGDANTAYLSEKHAYMLFSRYKLTRINNTDLIKDGYLHLRSNFFRRKRFSLEPFCQYQFDIGRGLTERYLLGSNIRFHLFNKNKWQLNLGSGLMYEHEFWQGKIIHFALERDSSKAINDFVKITNHFSFKHDLGQSSTLFVSSFLQFRPSQPDKPRVITDFILQFKINKRLAFNMDYAVSFDRQAIVRGNEYLYNATGGLVIKIE